MTTREGIKYELATRGLTYNKHYTDTDVEYILNRVNGRGMLLGYLCDVLLAEVGE